MFLVFFIERQAQFLEENKSINLCMKKENTWERDATESISVLNGRLFNSCTVEENIINQNLILHWYHFYKNPIVSQEQG